jgi:heme-degrading monooxygenase HmoA
MLLFESRLKPGKKEEFLEGWRKEVLPLLKQQSGFIDEMLVCDDEKQQTCIGLCFWKSREEGERYRRQVFRQTKDLVGHLCSNPRVRGFEVEASATFNLPLHGAG